MKIFLFLPLAFLALAACKKDDTPAAVPSMQLTGTLSGSSEVPANPSTASGTVTGSYVPSTNVLNYTVTYTGLTPNAGHIHFGLPGKKGTVTIPFGNALTSPITGTTTLSPEQADSLKAGRMYANLHTPTYGDGEIRANLTVK